MMAENSTIKIACEKYDRMLSPMESFCIQMNSEIPQGTYVQVTVLDSKQNLPEFVVRKALKALSSHHYLMQARVVKAADGSLSYASIENMDDEGDWIQLELLSASSVGDWRSLIAEDLKHPLDMVNGPLWRAKWISCPADGNTFCYVFVIVAIHSIIDGKVGVDLSTNQFLTLVHAILEGKEASLPIKPIFFTYPNDTVFLNVSSETSMKDFPVPWYVRVVGDFGFWIIEKMLKYRRSDTTPLVSTNTNDAFYTFEIDTETSTKLRNLTKHEGVTIHSVLLVLLGNALKDAEKEGLLKQPFSKIIYPIDLRKFNDELHARPLPMGCFTSSGPHSINYHDVSGKHFFNYVRKVKKSVEKHNKVSAAPHMIAFLVHAMNRGKFQDLIAFNNDAITLSNAGDFDNMIQYKIDSNNIVEVVAQYYTLSRGGFFVTTSTVNQKMFFCVSYNPFLITENMLAFFENDIKVALQALIEQL